MSDYYRKLEKDAKHRYIAKLSAMGLSVDKDDPFIGEDESNADWSQDVRKWPSLEFGAIYVYLIDTPGPFTREALHAYRSLDAYNFYVNGFVQTCYCRRTGKGICVVKAEVMRSQAVTEKPHRAWVAIRETDGAVECGHCTCMAGLGEVCSHVAGILFKVEAATRLQYNKAGSCTSDPCVWNQTSVKKVQPELLHNIRFDQPRHGRQLSSVAAALSSPTFSDTTAFKTALRQSAPSAVLFTVTDPAVQPSTSDHSAAEPETVCNVKPLCEMFEIDYSSFTLPELQTLAETVEIAVSGTECDAIEKATRGQHMNDNWYKHRAGRVTASKLKAVCGTKIGSPSMSLLKATCYPQSVSVQTAATKWGVNKEILAKEAYCKSAVSSHDTFLIEDRGVVINPKFPHLAASPDGFVSCRCCGNGVLEIKCPFKARSLSVLQYLDSKDSCFHYPESTDIDFTPGHQYYCQAQAQLFVCDVQYCDFVVCTFPEDEPEIFVKRVYRDTKFWDRCLQRATVFFRSCILPQLMGEAYMSHKPVKPKLDEC